MKFAKDEQETIITFEAGTGEWDVYTCVPSHITLFMKNERIANADIEVLTAYGGKPTSIRFTVENSAISVAGFIKKKRIKREPSEKQLQARQKFANMAKARSESK